MRTACRFGTMVLICLYAATVSAEDRPADAVPSDVLVYAELSTETVQELLGMLARPPVLGMAQPGGRSSPFAHIDGALGLDLGTARRCAPHLVAAGISIPTENPKRNSVLVLTFDDRQWSQALMAGARPAGEAVHARVAGGGQPAMVAVGKHLLIGESTQYLDRIADTAGDFKALSAAPVFAEAATGADGSPAWAWVNIPGLGETIRSTARGDEREVWAILEHVVGLVDVRSAVLTVSSADGTAALNTRFLLEDNAQGVLALLPETGAASAKLVPADAAGALTLHWGDPKAFWGGFVDGLVRAADSVGAGQDFRNDIQQVEAGLGMSLVDIAAMLGDGMAFYLQPRGEYNMIGRADWAVAVKLTRPYEFKRVLETAFEGEGIPLATQDRGGLPVTQWPGERVFYAFAEPGMVVAGSAASVKARMDWLGQAERATLEPVDPKAAGTLSLSFQSLVRSYPLRQPRNRVLFDDPADAVDRHLDEDMIGGAIFAGLWTNLLGNEMGLTLKRTGRSVDLKLTASMPKSAVAPLFAVGAITWLTALGATAEEVMMEEPPAIQDAPDNDPPPQHVLPD